MFFFDALAASGHWTKVQYLVSMDFDIYDPVVCRRETEPTAGTVKAVVLFVRLMLGGQREC